MRVAIYDLPSLYPNKNDIDRFNLHWIVGCLGSLYDDLAGARLDASRFPRVNH
jgi:hypothetical protein